MVTREQLATASDALLLAVLEHGILSAPAIEAAERYRELMLRQTREVFDGSVRSATDALCRELR